ERGKWMDGWETRRRRDDGTHDWCIVRLGVPGIVRGIDVDTAFFKGNFPASCAIDACDIPGLPAADDLAAAPWSEILPQRGLQGASHTLFAVGAARGATRVGRRISRGGGGARLGVYGDVAADGTGRPRRGDVDPAAADPGGLVTAGSDFFFGSRHNLIMPG